MVRLSPGHAARLDAHLFRGHAADRGIALAGVRCQCLLALHAVQAAASRRDAAAYVGTLKTAAGSVRTRAASPAKLLLLVLLLLLLLLLLQHIELRRGHRAIETEAVARAAMAANWGPSATMRVRRRRRQVRAGVRGRQREARQAGQTAPVAAAARLPGGSGGGGMLQGARCGEVVAAAAVRRQRRAAAREGGAEEVARSSREAARPNLQAMAC